MHKPFKDMNFNIPDTRDNAAKKELSIEQVGNLIKEEAEKDFKKEMRKQELPITTAFTEDRKKFLNYAVSLIDRGKYPAHRALLIYRINGYNIMQIAEKFKVDPKIILYMEKDAMKIAKDTIRATRNNGIPIIGGGN